MLLRLRAPSQSHGCQFERVPKNREYLSYVPHLLCLRNVPRSTSTWSHPPRAAHAFSSMPERPPFPAPISTTHVPGFWSASFRPSCPIRCSIDVARNGCLLRFVLDSADFVFEHKLAHFRQQLLERRLASRAWVGPNCAHEFDNHIITIRKLSIQGLLIQVVTRCKRPRVDVARKMRYFCRRGAGRAP